MWLCSGMELFEAHAHPFSGCSLTRRAGHRTLLPRSSALLIAGMERESSPG